MRRSTRTLFSALERIATIASRCAALLEDLLGNIARAPTTPSSPCPRYANRSPFWQPVVPLVFREREADRILRAFLGHLPTEERDVFVILKHSEVCELIEAATDRCDDVANTIEGIVIEA